MEFTPCEILAINEIAGYGELFGLPLHIHDDESGETVKELVKSLETKGIMKESRLTDIGIMVTMLFEKYDRAARHLFINRSRMAIDGDSIIAFIKKEDTIDIIRKHKVKAIEDIIMSQNYLRRPQKKTFFKPQPMRYSEDQWMGETIDRYPNFLLIQGFGNRILEKHVCLAWNDDAGCCYDYHDKTLLEMGPRDLRIYLLKLFEVEVEEDGRN